MYVWVMRMAVKSKKKRIEERREKGWEYTLSGSPRSTGTVPERIRSVPPFPIPGDGGYASEIVRQ